MSLGMRLGSYTLRMRSAWLLGRVMKNDKRLGSFRCVQGGYREGGPQLGIAIFTKLRIKMV